MMTSVWSLFLILLLFRLLLKERKGCRLVVLNLVSRVATRRSLSSPTVTFRKVMLIPAVDQPLVNLYSRFPLSFCEIYFQQLGLSCFVFSQLRFSDASNFGKCCFRVCSTWFSCWGSCGSSRTFLAHWSHCCRTCKFLCS